MDIIERLQAEHVLLLAQLDYLNELCANDRPPEMSVMKGVILTITSALNHHAALEDRALFPALERFLGKWMGPMEIVEFEHQEINKILDALKKASDPRSVRIEAAKFVMAMRDHIEKEERVIFPEARKYLTREKLIELDAMENAA